MTNPMSEVEVICKIIEDLQFVAMADEFRHEPAKRERIVKVITRIIRREQDNEKANRFFYLASQVIEN